ncbi:DUF6392 family protein [Alcanivoracaceae bacterium MT1]
MSAKSIIGYVSGIGHTFDELLSKGVIQDVEKEKTDPESDEFFILLENKGVELTFHEGSGVLQLVVVTLSSDTPDIAEYSGSLPDPLRPNMNQTDVRATYGPPVSSKAPYKLPILGLQGGIDIYHLPDFGNIKIAFYYTADSRVNSINFSSY